MITHTQRERLIRFCNALMDQKAARILIHARQAQPGFWFGGGNLAEAPNGDFYLVGRYRTEGDSRTGLGMGERGLELVIFHSTDRGRYFEKILTFSKAALGLPRKAVLSIEGSALHWTDDGVELFVSSEKKLPYPPKLEVYQKPNTGVWTIERLAAPTVEALASAQPQTILECDDPRYLHVKDPFVLDQPNGDTVLGFVTHPFSWASSNSAYARRPAGTQEFQPPVYNFFPRGFVWDVAICRATGWLRVPRLGVFAEGPDATLLFYDGGESMRDLDEHSAAAKRPRGYSCEELGGVAVTASDGVSQIERLSVISPFFVSPTGTGTSRYARVLETAEGFYAIWQQSQADLSQPLVMNFLSRERAAQLLGE
ncbi:MAG: hypothetical protein KF753_17570 [Caldilineaceae bacterium]|nr:hypothetical protein [Caldilineaceae bacterium]